MLSFEISLISEFFLRNYGKGMRLSFITIVARNNIPITSDRLLSFFISETKVFSPNIYGVISDVASNRIALIARSVLRSSIVNGGSNIYDSSIKYSIVRVFISRFKVSFWIVIGLSEALANAHAKALAKMHPIWSCVRG
jgi:hypothetical protein